MYNIYNNSKDKKIMKHKNITFRYDAEDNEFIEALNILKEHSINKSAFFRNSIIKESKKLAEMYKEHNG